MTETFLTISIRAVSPPPSQGSVVLPEVQVQPSDTIGKFLLQQEGDRQQGRLFFAGCRLEGTRTWSSYGINLNSNDISRGVVELDMLPPLPEGEGQKIQLFVKAPILGLSTTLQVDPMVDTVDSLKQRIQDALGIAAPGQQKLIHHWRGQGYELGSDAGGGGGETEGRKLSDFMLHEGSCLIVLKVARFDISLHFRGSTQVVSVQPGDTISKLRGNLDQQTQQKESAFFYGNLRLIDESLTLDDYCIESGSGVDVEELRDEGEDIDPPVGLHIYPLGLSHLGVVGGFNLTRVKPGDSVLSLKQQIKSVTGVPVEDQRLMYGRDTPLEDGRLFRDYLEAPPLRLTLANDISAPSSPDFAMVRCGGCADLDDLLVPDPPPPLPLGRSSFPVFINSVGLGESSAFRSKCLEGVTLDMTVEEVKRKLQKLCRLGARSDDDRVDGQSKNSQEDDVAADDVLPLEAFHISAWGRRLENGHVMGEYVTVGGTVVNVKVVPSPDWGTRGTAMPVARDE